MIVVLLAISANRTMNVDAAIDPVIYLKASMRTHLEKPELTWSDDEFAFFAGTPNGCAMTPYG